MEKGEGLRVKKNGVNEVNRVNVVNNVSGKGEKEDIGVEVGLTVLLFTL